MEKNAWNDREMLRHSVPRSRSDHYLFNPNEAFELKKKTRNFTDSNLKKITKAAIVVDSNKFYILNAPFFLRKEKEKYVQKFIEARNIYW